MTRALIEMFDTEGRLIRTDRTRLEKRTDPTEMFNYNIDVFKVPGVTRSFSLVFYPNQNLFYITTELDPTQPRKVLPFNNTEFVIDPNMDLFECYITTLPDERVRVTMTKPFEMQGIHELRVTIPDNLDTVEK